MESNQNLLPINSETSLEISKKEIQDPDYVETITYRGISCDIFNDDYGQCFYTTFDGEEISFGTYNFDYKDDLKYMIDYKLDTITKFSDEPKFAGARLTYFDNAGHRDIELLYRSRIIKVYLVGDPEQVNTQAIEVDAVKCLRVICK